MKTLSIIIMSFLIIATTFAQKPDKLLIRVRYTQMKKNDMLANGKPRYENMMLFVGKNASLFTSYDKLAHEISEDQKFRTRALTGNAPAVTIIDNKPTELMSKIDYFYFTKENILVTKEVIALQSYIIEEPAPKINWKITKDTASFSGINCTKAIANYENKNWIVWFAPGLPFQTGPWKLNSLPGLIVDAYDENKDLHYQFAGIDNAKDGDIQRSYDVTKRPNAQPGDYNPVDQMIGRDVASAYFDQLIKLPIGAVKTTREEFEKLREAFKKDPRGFVKSQSRY